MLKRFVPFVVVALGMLAITGSTFATGTAVTGPSTGLTAVTYGLDSGSVTGFMLTYGGQAIVDVAALGLACAAIVAIFNKVRHLLLRKKTLA